MHRGAGYLKEEEIRLRETANIRFIDWAEDLFELGMEVGVYIVVGSMVSEVIKAAKKEETDLIVIGRPHKGVLEQLYSGSDVTELLRRAATPVLVYKHLSETKIAIEKPFERPLLAMDWSPASLRAAEYLKVIKDIIHEIHIVHVVGEKELKGTSAMEIQGIRKKTRKKLEDICEMFEYGGVKADAHVYIGNAEQEIEKAAREHQASMIVLGSSGKTAWAERWLGSTPQSIAEESIYPTLLIPFEKK
jgi:nucleotide-binding universal stress UspA family protein